MGRPSRFSADDIRIIAAMRRQGKSWRAIGARVGRANTVCRRVWVECMGNPGGWARDRGPGRARDHRRRQPRNGQPLPAGSPITAEAIRLPCMSALEAYR